LRGERRRGGGLVIGWFVGAGRRGPGAGERVERELAAAFDPFIVLFG
jgi:hypothetical protein